MKPRSAARIDRIFINSPEARVGERSLRLRNIRTGSPIPENALDTTSNNARPRKKRGPGIIGPRAFVRLRWTEHFDYFLAPRIASLAALATRNFTFLRFGTWIV